MNSNRVRINLDVSELLAKEIKQLAEQKDISVNALIRLALELYIKQEMK